MYVPHIFQPNSNKCYDSDNVPMSHINSVCTLYHHPISWQWQFIWTQLDNICKISSHGYHHKPKLAA